MAGRVSWAWVGGLVPQELSQEKSCLYCHLGVVAVRGGTPTEKACHSLPLVLCNSITYSVGPKLEGDTPLPSLAYR